MMVGKRYKKVLRRGGALELKQTVDGAELHTRHTSHQHIYGSEEAELHKSPVEVPMSTGRGSCKQDLEKKKSAEDSRG